MVVVRFGRAWKPVSSMAASDAMPTTHNKRVFVGCIEIVKALSETISHSYRTQVKFTTGQL